MTDKNFDFDPLSYEELLATADELDSNEPDPYELEEEPDDEDWDDDYEDDEDIEDDDDDMDDIESYMIH